MGLGWLINSFRVRYGICCIEIEFRRKKYPFDILEWCLRGSSQYAAHAEMPLSQFLLRGEGRSSLKYIMSVLLSDFEYFIEKKFDLSISILDSC